MCVCLRKMPHAYVRYARARQRTIESRKRQLALGPCLPSESINFLNQASNFLRPATAMLWQTTIASQTVIITVWVYVCLVRCSHFMLSHMCLPFFGERLFNAFALLASF